MTRIAHLADLHVGAALRDLARYPGAPELDPSALALLAFERLLADVIAAAPDAVLVAGDVFDRDVPPERALPVVQAALDALAGSGIRVAMIAGNHDAETGALTRLRLPAGVALLRDEAAETLIWEDLGLAIVGRSIARADEDRDLAAGYPAAPAGLRTIGMLHTSLTGELSRRACAPTTADVLDRPGYAYWALGHVHSPIAVGGTTPAWFAGGGHGRRVEELGARGWLEVTLGDADGAVEVRHRATAPVRYESLDPGELGLDGLATLLDAGPEAAHAVVWVLPERHAGLLDAARELAARDARFLVVPGR